MRPGHLPLPPGPEATVARYRPPAAGSSGVSTTTFVSTALVTAGGVATAEWSSFWGTDNVTDASISISFPHAPYAISLLEERYRLLAAPGDVLFVNPTYPFRREESSRCNVINDFITYAPEVLRDVLGEWDEAVRDRPDRPFVWSSVTPDAATFRIQRLLFAYLSRAEEIDPLLAEEVAIHLLTEIARCAYRIADDRARLPRSASTVRTHRTIVAETLEHVLANLADRLRLEDIGRAVGVSPTHLCVIFRAVTGCTIHQAIRRLRLRLAYDRLPDYRGRLTRLALELGFANGNQFSAAFREEFGHPPSEEGRLVGDGDGARLERALAASLTGGGETGSRRGHRSGDPPRSPNPLPDPSSPTVFSGQEGSHLHAPQLLHKPGGVGIRAPRRVRPLGPDSRMLQ